MRLLSTWKGFHQLSWLDQGAGEGPKTVFIEQTLRHWQFYDGDVSAGCHGSWLVM